MAKQLRNDSNSALLYPESIDEDLLYQCLITDGRSRVLGQVQIAPPREVAIPLASSPESIVTNPFSPSDLIVTNPFEPSESIIANPSMLVIQQNVAVTAPPGEAVAEAQELYSNTSTDKHWIPVYDRNFDVGVEAA
jgi:hypothetical protein